MAADCDLTKGLFQKLRGRWRKGERLPNLALSDGDGPQQCLRAARAAKIEDAKTAAAQDRMAGSIASRSTKPRCT
jgi:hypothetical protein